MASKMYGKLLPDYGDLDNKTGNCPGYRVYILEKDGGVSLQMIHADKNPVSEEPDAVFLNVEEAREMVEALQQAIDRADSKNADHPRRGEYC